MKIRENNVFPAKELYKILIKKPFKRLKSILVDFMDSETGSAVEYEVEMENMVKLNDQYRRNLH